MKKALLFLMSLTLGLNAARASVTLPYSFTAAGTIRASEMNADLGALRDEINTHEGLTNAHNTTLASILSTANSCGSTPINFNLTQAQSFRVENLSADPACAVGNKGQLEFNTVSGLFKICDGSSFVSIAGTGVNNLSSVLNASNSAGAFNIDLNQNQLLNARVENRSSDPSTGNAGRLWWNTTSSTLKLDTGSTVQAIGGAQSLSSVMSVGNQASTNLDLNGNQLVNSRWENLASDPGTTTGGRVYYNTASNKPRFYNGSGWADVGNTNTLAATLLLGNSVGSTDVNFNNRQAQSLRLHNLAAPPGTGTPGVIWYDTGSNQLGYETTTSNHTIATLDDAQTLTNKTISGASNTLSNIPDAALSGNVGLNNGSQTISATKTFSSAPIISKIKTPSGTTLGHTITDGLADDTFVLANAVQTLAGKTLNAPTLSGNLDAAEFQLKNVRVDNVSSTPAAGNAGRVIYKTTTGELQYDTGSTWQTLGISTGPGLATVLGVNNSAGALNINMNENQLLAARIENLAADPAFGNVGRLIYNTTSNQVKIDNGAAWIVVSGAVTPNLSAVLAAGNSAGANNLNINENQLIGARLENLGSAPAAGNIGRAYWNTANADIEVDTGSAIKQVADLNSAQTLSNKTVTLGAANAVVVTNGSSNITTSATLPIANGGTNANSAANAFNNLSPMTTLGDVIYGGASGAATRLAGNITAAKQFLSQTGTGAVSAAPAWGALATGDIPSLDFSKITTGTVPIAQGGTGQTAKTAAFDALSPNTTKADITVHNGTNNIRLGVGANNAVLTADSTQATGVKWASVPSPNLATASKTANYTALISDDILFGDSSGGTFTFTLPAASGNAGKVLRFKKTDSTFTAITIARAGADTIDSATSTTLNTKNEVLALVSDGTANWSILSRDYPRSPTPFTMTINGAASNPTKGTATEIAYWTRSGKLMNIYYSLIQTVAGSAGSGNYYFVLPGGLTADSTYVDTGGNQNNNIVGHGQTAANADASSQSVEVWLQNSTNMMLGAVGGSIVGSAFFSLSNGTVKFVFRATVPISTWN